MRGMNGSRWVHCCACESSVVGGGYRPQTRMQVDSSARTNEVAPWCCLAMRHQSHRLGDTTLPRHHVRLALFVALFAALANHASASHPYTLYSWKTPLWNQTWADRLKKDLLVRYDKYARPTEHYNTTVVTVDIVIHHVSLDDMKSIFSVNAWLRMAWNDEKLKWNSTNYGGLKEIQLGSHEIWQPDIYLFNSATGSTVEHYGDTHCLVFEDGTVFWVPPSHFLALCNLNLKRWPFDTQLCDLHLGSWIFSGKQLDLRLEESNDSNNDLLINNTEWELINITKVRNNLHYSCCDEGYVKLIFNLTIRRNAKLYYNLIFTPTVLIVFFTLITFWLPPQSEMKLTLGGCTALIDTIILIYLGSKIPPTDNVPLIVNFYSGCLYQITFSLIFSVLVINMSKKTYSTPVPRIIKCLLLTTPVAYLGVSDLIKTIKFHKPICSQELHENHSDSVTSNNYSETERLNKTIPMHNIVHLEWILLATVIDRILFIVFCASFSIMALMYIT